MPHASIRSIRGKGDLERLSAEARLALMVVLNLVDRLVGTLWRLVLGFEMQLGQPTMLMVLRAKAQEHVL